MSSALDVDALREASDRLVDGAADPAAARALVVKVWALGASAADDLLADLCRAAERIAARTGAEPSAAELLEAVGRAAGAQHLRAAVESGLIAHERAAKVAAEAALDAEREVERAASATRAARAATRLARVWEHRSRRAA
ncbi:hypothetical protein SAMN06264364_1515 [Quadrisphaera granulorum]|uniref:Uncharacterized protein n=1 Tax=Quadrisphaera granulorum TaxID=317664 RepID=A0A315ZKE6_9ACTN|nr:hypothetical protein [Quadrisphaera granulorum]PWJ45792.1 hypothetical protein BXY45_1515 [Quadrisphaera granulorum]SZE99126.1 hypothetical protein SAMN06264364_1515 [Quadrisphaera granulorum]